MQRVTPSTCSSEPSEPHSGHRSPAWVLASATSAAVRRSPSASSRSSSAGGSTSRLSCSSFAVAMSPLYLALALAAGSLACSPAPPAAPASAATPSTEAPSAPAPAASAGSDAEPASAAAADAAPPASGAPSVVGAAPPASAALAPRVPPLTATVRVKAALFSEHPRVAFHAPGSLKHLETTPVVVFFHGWYGCLRVLLGSDHAPCQPGKPTRISLDLVGQFDAAGVDALLVVPQLAFDEASSVPHGLARPGRFGSMLGRDPGPARSWLVAYLPDSRALGRVILVGHSGAYLPLGRALGVGGVDVSEVWMMDAFYLDVPELLPWFQQHEGEFWPGRRRRMVFLYTEDQKTGPRTGKLLASLAARLPAEDRGAALWQGEAPRGSLPRPTWPARW